MNELKYYSDSVPAIIAPAYTGDAGYDLMVSADGTIPAHGISAIQLDLFLAIPEGHVGMICDRSSMARRGVKVLGGIVDASYRGRVVVVLVNLTDRPCILDEGDRIAQLLVLPVNTPALTRVANETELGYTDRGGNGFGSTNRVKESTPA